MRGFIISLFFVLSVSTTAVDIEWARISSFLDNMNNGETHRIIINMDQYPRHVYDYVVEKCNLHYHCYLNTAEDKYKVAKENRQREDKINQKKCNKWRKYEKCLQTNWDNRQMWYHNLPFISNPPDQLVCTKPYFDCIGPNSCAYITRGPFGGRFESEIVIENKL